MLFTFPSRYLFTIDLQTYLALEDGPPRFKPDYTCPILLRNTLDLYPIFADGAITLYGGPFQAPSARDEVCNSSGSAGASPGIPYNTSTT